MPEKVVLVLSPPAVSALLPFMNTLPPPASEPMVLLAWKRALPLTVSALPVATAPLTSKRTRPVPLTIVEPVYVLATVRRRLSSPRLFTNVNGPVPVNAPLMDVVDELLPDAHASWVNVAGPFRLTPGKPLVP